MRATYIFIKKYFMTYSPRKLVCHLSVLSQNRGKPENWMKVNNAPDASRKVIPLPCFS